MIIVSFQNYSIFYNRYIKCIEQEVFRIERIIFSRYYMVNPEKCEIVFKRLASNCMYTYYDNKGTIWWYVHACAGFVIR